MKKFVPAHYKSETSTPRLHDPPIYYEKGGFLKINPREFEKLVGKLREQASSKISNLQGVDYENFRKFLKIIELFYATDSYPILYEIVSNNFRDLQEVHPGTIGSYCIGCSKTPKFSGDLVGCSPLCAGNLSPSGSAKSSPCPHGVYFLEFQNQSFNIKSMSNGVNNPNTAFLFSDFSSYTDFLGLSRREKKMLKSQGIDQVQMFSISDHSPWFSNFVPLKDIKERASAEVEESDDSLDSEESEISSSKFNTNTGIITTLVVLVFLICLFLIIRRQH